MAKIVIKTYDDDVHTKATEMDVPHQHGDRTSDTVQIYTFDVDDKVAIAKGFKITNGHQVILPEIAYFFSDNEKAIATLLAESDFDPMRFLDAVAQAREKYVAEREQINLKKQREEEEQQRRDFARKQARELLADELTDLKKQIEAEQEKVLKREQRISDLEGYLTALIKASSTEALVKAGLYKAQPEEDEETTPEQQEALETCGLDC